MVISNDDARSHCGKHCSLQSDGARCDMNAVSGIIKTMRAVFSQRQLVNMLQSHLPLSHDAHTIRYVHSTCASGICIPP